MRKKITSLRTLLIAAGLCMGSSVWAAIVETTVVDCDFENNETLFTESSRITVGNETNTGINSKVVKFTCADNSQNGYSLATYNFSSVIGNDATSVKVAFDFYIPNANAAYRRFFTVGQANLRTGFGKTSYSTSGAMFAFGLARNSSANYFSINGASTKAAASATNVLAAWAHAEIIVDLSEKTVSYNITSLDGNTTYYTGSNVAFTDASAATCNQIDFFDCQNNQVSYMDNLVITKYVDQSKVATTYTIKYQNADGTDLKDAVNYDTYVGDTYTASSTDMATFYSADTNTKYVYTSGNTSNTAKSTASENVITLVFNEYNKVAYTVTAKDGETSLGELASGDAYTDGSTTVYWSKYIKVGEQWYETTGSYGKVITEAGNSDVAYTASNIAYFVESENIHKSRSAAAEVLGTQYSGGKAQRHYASSQWWTDSFEDGGVFTLTFPYRMANASASTINIKTRDAEGNYTDTGLELTASTAGTFSQIVIIPAGSSLALVKGEYNSNILIDYLTLTPCTATATIGSTGWTTFASSYALDLANMTVSEGDVTAFYASAVSESTVTMTSTDATVAAGTGLMLKGTAGATVTIPAAVSGDAIAGNLLVGCTSEQTLDANAYLYVLVNNGGTAEFQSLEDNGATIPAGKAYLNAKANGAKLRIAFEEDDATAIKAIATEEVKDNVIYNLSGQRVVKPLKGIYIQNGKKILVK